MTIMTINAKIRILFPKSGRIIINAVSFTRRHIVAGVTHDKCGSPMVNTGELICMLKSNI